MLIALRNVARLIIAALTLLCGGLAHAADAEVLMVVGAAEFREKDAGGWKPLQIKQQLSAGAAVRTGDASQVALLLRDQTQVRVNQRSVLSVSSVQTEQETALSLVRGRFWAQVKTFLRSVTAVVGRANRVKVTTPSATIGIRGTDWDLEVGEDGKTVLTVLSGQAQMSNEFGQVAVGPNEQASAERGKAPVKQYLSQARDRVQWVTAYRPAPRRWLANVPSSLQATVTAIEAGDYASALKRLQGASAPERAERLLLADLYLLLGRADDALVLLKPLVEAGDAMASALSGRALILAGRLDEARQSLAQGAARHPEEIEVALALADVARLQGNASEALKLFSDVIASQPKSAEGWFGVGRVQTELEDIAAARAALDMAIRLSPDAAGYYGERGTLEALAGEFAAARRAFGEAIERQPDDYLAWTGLGILQLKMGETEQALQSFLKAGVLEPRFARAHLYVGVTYYRLENVGRAVEAVMRAAELDPKDPLPYVLLGLMHGDALELRLASDAAREAQLRMPFLKSLNQLLSDQKGSANVGSALAAQGMEEWARAYASDSYNGYWAGSALFLSDRYGDGYNKNSELYRGFLLDPTVFGASNRASSIVQAPGHYGSIAYLGSREDFTQHTLQGKANGLTATSVPIAYSVTGEYADGHDARPGQNAFQAHGSNLTIGLGAKPSYALSTFYFGTSTDVNGHFSDPSLLPDARLSVKVARHDLGLGYRFGPRNQVWLKLGDGSQKVGLSGSQVDNANAAALSIPGLLTTSPAAQLDKNDLRLDQADVQWRHSFDLSPGRQVTWGYEDSHDDKSLGRDQTYTATLTPCVTLNPPAITPAGCVPVPILHTEARRDLKSSGFYVSGVQSVGSALDLQLDLHFQRTRSKGLVVEDAEIVDRRPGGGADILPLGSVRTETPEESSFRELNHRFGLRFATGPGQNVRIAYQRWRRPFGTGSLGSTETVGIPVEDRLVDSGGLVKQLKLRLDWELGKNQFFQITADRREVTNLESRAEPYFAQFGLTELAALRPRKPVFDQPFDELEETPRFGQGKVGGGGFALNWLLPDRYSFAGRYILSSSENTGPGFVGKKVPLIPRHYVNLSLYKQVSGRWLVATTAIYRSKRFVDEANTVELTEGWNFGVRMYWESDDKRWSVEAAATNLHADKQSALERRAQFNVTSVYRF